MKDDKSVLVLWGSATLFVLPHLSSFSVKIKYLVHSRGNVLHLVHSTPRPLSHRTTSVKPSLETHPHARFTPSRVGARKRYTVRLLNSCLLVGLRLLQNLHHCCASSLTNLLPISANDNTSRATIFLAIQGVFNMTYMPKVYGCCGNPADAKRWTCWPLEIATKCWDRES